MLKINQIGPLIVILFVVWIIASGSWKEYWSFVSSDEVETQDKL